MSTGGIGFAGAAQDDEFETLLQKTYSEYAIDDPFGISDLLFSPPTVSQHFSLEPAVQQFHDEVTPEPSSDQDYVPKRSKKRESSTSEEQNVREKRPKLIQADDLKDLPKGIERLKKVLADFKENSEHQTMPAGLSPVEQRKFQKLLKKKNGAQIGRYQKAITELETKQEYERLKSENSRLNDHNRSLLRSNAELNSRLTIMTKLQQHEVDVVKTSHQEQLKSLSELKEKLIALQTEKEKQEQDSAETIEDLCKKLTALKEVESHNDVLQKQLHDLSVEKVQLGVLLEDTKKDHQRYELNMQKLTQAFQATVAHSEAEKQVTQQKMAETDRHREAYIAQKRQEFAQALRPLQARVNSLIDQERRHVSYIAELETRISHLESECARHRFEYDEITTILQRRERECESLESLVENAEEQHLEDLEYIRRIEAENRHLNLPRSPNPPLIYSRSHRPERNLVTPTERPKSSQNRSKFS